MSRATNSLEANKLMDKLTLEAVNLFYIGGNPDDPEVRKLEEAIALVAEAWDLPENVIVKSRETIEIEREATRSEKSGEKTQTAIPQEEILQCNGGDDIMEVLWGLFETAVRLDTREKRDHILQCARFMADYLGLEEWVTNSDPLPAKTTA